MPWSLEFGIVNRHSQMQRITYMNDLTIVEFNLDKQSFINGKIRDLDKYY